MKKFILLICICIEIPINAQIPVLKLTGDFGYEYKDATVSIIMPDGTTKENLTGKIKWRGGTTNTEGKHKRNYKIKFDADQQLFGLRTDNNWILDAGQADVFRLRNRIATELWNDFSKKPYYYEKENEVFSGVRGNIVELYLNDEYRGIYCLTECIDRKELKLKKFDKKSGIIKGVLWKAEGYGISQMFNIIPYDNKSETWDTFEIKYPDLDDVQETDYSTLYNAIDFVINSSNEDFSQHIHEYFDIPVLIDYYIFLHTLNAFDNRGKNMYWAVYDKTENKKITLAVWDLDGSFGQRWIDQYIPNSSSPDFDFDICMKLYYRLKENNPNNFNENVIERYHQLRNNYLSTESLINRFKSYYNIIKESGAAEREEEKWSKDSDINGEIINFEKELDYITDWITKHMNYLDENVFSSTNAINTIPYHNTNNYFYTINGIKTNTLTKGIYIQNGKKYIIK